MAQSVPSESFAHKWPSLYFNSSFEEQITNIHAFYSIRWQVNDSIHFILDQDGLYTDTLGLALGSNKVIHDNFRFRHDSANPFFVASTDRTGFVYTVHRDPRGTLTLIRYRTKCDRTCHYKPRDWIHICDDGESRIRFSKSCQANVYWKIFTGFFYQNKLFLVGHSIVFVVPTAANNQSVQVATVSRRDFFQCQTEAKVRIAPRLQTLGPVTDRDGRTLSEKSKYSCILS